MSVERVATEKTAKEIKDILEAMAKELHDISQTLDCISRNESVPM